MVDGGLSMADGERDLADSGVPLPPRYRAFLQAALNLSPATWAREDEALDRLDLFHANAQAGPATLTPTAPPPPDHVWRPATFERQRRHLREVPS
ncbi:hypothetical protein [Streptomyces sp. NBC_01190]|uniref:hypothetical protein n=1 Tax=Streptomyces sp. NBC_01190 TaxID=2903767 RepID=UPI003870BC05|nr:hypothetical protein OG519_24120 [Streptomyces sp. NBC_01190]